MKIKRAAGGSLLFLTGAAICFGAAIPAVKHHNGVFMVLMGLLLYCLAWAIFYPFAMLLRTRQVPPENLAGDEIVAWTDKPAHVGDICWHVGCALLGTLIVPILVSMWIWLRAENVCYVLTPTRLVVSSGVFGRREDDIELFRVKDVRLKQSFVDRLFRLADITLLGADVSLGDFVARSVSRPREARERIRLAVAAARAQSGVRLTEVQ